MVTRIEDRMALAIKLTKNTIYSEIIKSVVDMYNEDKDERHMQSINVLMPMATGNSHWACYHKLGDDEE
jgi:hypothetical protein